MGCFGSKKKSSRPPKIGNPKQPPSRKEKNKSSLGFTDPEMVQEEPGDQLPAQELVAQDDNPPQDDSDHVSVNPGSPKLGYAGPSDDDTSVPAPEPVEVKPGDPVDGKIGESPGPKRKMSRNLDQFGSRRFPAPNSSDIPEGDSTGQVPPHAEPPSDSEELVTAVADPQIEKPASVPQVASDSSAAKKVGGMGGGQSTVGGAGLMGNSPAQKSAPSVLEDGVEGSFIEHGNTVLPSIVQHRLYYRRRPGARNQEKPEIVAPGPSLGEADQEDFRTSVQRDASATKRVASHFAESPAGSAENRLTKDSPFPKTNVSIAPSSPSRMAIPGRASSADYVSLPSSPSRMAFPGRASSVSLSRKVIPSQSTKDVPLKSTGPVEMTTEQSFTDVPTQPNPKWEARNEEWPQGAQQELMSAGQSTPLPSKPINAPAKAKVPSPPAPSAQENFQPPVGNAPTEDIVAEIRFQSKKQGAPFKNVERPQEPVSSPPPADAPMLSPHVELSAKIVPPGERPPTPFQHDPNLAEPEMSRKAVPGTFSPPTQDQKISRRIVPVDTRTQELQIPQVRIPPLPAQNIESHPRNAGAQTDLREITPVTRDMFPQGENKAIVPLSTVSPSTHRHDKTLPHPHFGGLPNTPEEPRNIQQHGRVPRGRIYPNKDRLRNMLVKKDPNKVPGQPVAKQRDERIMLIPTNKGENMGKRNRKRTTSVETEIDIKIHQKYDDSLKTAKDVSYDVNETYKQTDQRR